MGSLTGRTIALLETRQLEVLARLVEAEGATIVECPLIAIEDNPDRESVLRWIQNLIARPPDALILYTGEGVRRLVAFAEHAGLRASFIAALQRVRRIARGPKPVRALREIGLEPDVVTDEPTTDGLIAALSRETLQDRIFGLQLFGEDPADKLTAFLRSMGATVNTVSPYRYSASADDERIAGLIGRLQNGSIDLIAFTSASQVTQLLNTAHRLGLEDLLRTGLARTAVAAVGPVVASELGARQIRVDAIPERSFTMKPLVRAMATALSTRPPRQ